MLLVVVRGGATLPSVTAGPDLEQRSASENDVL